MDRYFPTIFFISFLLILFWFMQWYVLRNYVKWIYWVCPEHTYFRFRFLGFLFFAIANIIFLLRFPLTESGLYQDSLIQYLILYPGGIFFGMIILAFVFLLAINSGITALNLVQNCQPSYVKPESGTLNTGKINRRKFLRTTGITMIGAPFALTIGASAATSHDYRIVRQKLFFPEMNSAFNGLKIVQISDLHSGIFMTENQMRDIFRLVNEQHPDLITITGDFVDHSVAEIPALHSAVSELKSEYGIYGCLGNHDHYASSESVSSALRQRDIHILTNSHQTLTINGAPFTIAGIDDAGAGIRNYSRMDMAMNNISPDSFKILLSHRPDMFDDAIQYGMDLTLAGHTHGGQIGFDLLGIPVYPIRLLHKYPKGLYEYGSHKLYVNVGIGMAGVPVRLVRPEITVIELTNSIFEV